MSYLVKAGLPGDAGGAQPRVTVLLSSDAVSDEGADGADCAATPAVTVTSLLSGPLPTLLTASTLYAYVVPFVTLVSSYTVPFETVASAAPGYAVAPASLRQTL